MSPAVVSQSSLALRVSSVANRISSIFLDFFFELFSLSLQSISPKNAVPWWNSAARPKYCLSLAQFCLLCLKCHQVWQDSQGYPYFRGWNSARNIQSSVRCSFWWRLPQLRWTSSLYSQREAWNGSCLPIHLSNWLEPLDLVEIKLKRLAEELNFYGLWCVCIYFQIHI